jgi:hypothetical protein
MRKEKEDEQVMQLDLKFWSGTRRDGDDDALHE